ncbi:hypothetical protein GLOIN_2v1788562 [Rhizophagus clarus]|nr:hypothetical protein GLOIN_2v1788562 [Rhizophagus clarus]
MLSQLVVSTAKYIKDNVVNQTEINIDNSKSNHMLRNGQYVLGVGNRINSFSIVVDPKEKMTTETKSVMRESCSMIIYKIGDLPLYLAVGWKIPAIGGGRNKTFVFVRRENDLEIPDNNL